MFDPTSRYAGLPTLQQTLPDGRAVRYVAQRFLPISSAATLSEVPVAASERLDLLAARTLGDPTQYWRICDANAVLNPATIALRPGSTLLIPLADTFGGSA